MARDILNYLGEVIGELDLPAGTSEKVWEARLAFYALPPPTEVFKSITPRQIRLVLLSMGITNQMVIDAIETAIPEPEKKLAFIEWEYSIGFERSAPFVDAVGALLSLSSEQIDDLWRQAAIV